MNSALSAKIALISGGASGIGAASARAIIAAGGKVLIGDVDEAAGAALAKELGLSADFIRLDVTDPHDWKAAVEHTLSRFGKLNVLVNNAGIVMRGKLGEFSLDQWQRVIAINLTGVFLGMSAAVDALKLGAPSSIINVSSVAGLRGSAGMHAYTASKFGVRGITKSAAVELAPFGIRVNSLHPGATRTPMTKNISPSYANTLPLKRLGKPEEIANLVVALSSDDFSFSTGSEFIADGGEYAGPAVD
jgi:3alpha(or 20beta)-hydroxysteroid dehydrogenase